MFLCLCTFLLAGCQASDGETIRTAGTDAAPVGKDVESLQEENEVPEDGIISKEQMATIAGSDGTYYFHGETEDGIAYQWAYDGKKVQNPIEQKLKVECIEEGLEEIQTAAGNAPYGLGVVLQDMDMAAPATLTLTLTEKWEADRILYCTYADGTIYQLAQGEISQVKNGKQKVSQLTVTVSKAGDTFYFLGGSSQGAKNNKTKNKGEVAAAETAEATKAPNTNTNTNTNTQTDTTEEPGTDDNPQAVQGDGFDDNLQTENPGMDNQQTQQADPNTETSHTCTFSIECSTLVGNPDLKPEKAEFVPADGWILPATQVEFTPGESVFDVLKRICEQGGIQMESSYTPMYGSYYIEGIHQLYEFDGGGQSGWQYCVNGWFPNYGCSSYSVEDGDVIEWKYTCNLGSDVGNNSMGGES